jgi:enolase
VSDRIHQACAGQSFANQHTLDQALIALDGTPNKSALGANALLSVSLAFARAVASLRGVPLYQHFATILGQPIGTLPRLTVNLFSGGKHAGGQVAIQDVLLVPAAATTIDDSLAVVYAVYQAAAKLIWQNYAARALTADEGGLAPPFPNTEAMLAIDVAASHFYQNGWYEIDGELLDASQMIERLSQWCDRFPIVSVEDGLAEEDWPNWILLQERLAGRALVLGDDLLCTNPNRIRRAIEQNAANALLLKVNQAGTLTEAAEAYRLARAANWRVTISARSGETEDNWLADLAVGWNGDQIKIGSITHSERLAKYNRLLEIETESGLPVSSWPTTRR